VPWGLLRAVVGGLIANLLVRLAERHLRKRRREARLLEERLR